MVYVFPIILCLFLIYHYDYLQHSRGRMGWYLFLLIYCILVAGLRYRIGGDTVQYMITYMSYPDLSEYWSYDFDKTRFGRAYLFLNAIARSISNNFVVMQFILAIILNTVIFRFFYRNTTNIFTTVLLYLLLCYLNLNTEVLRESMAIACFLLSWEYFHRHKWFPYYLLCILAILFHPSSAFMLILPLFLLKFFKKFFSFSWLSVVLACGLFVLGVYITSRFFDVIRLIGIATLDNYADIYAETDYANAKHYNILGILVSLIIKIGYPLFIGYLLQQKFKFSSNPNRAKYMGALMVLLFVYCYINVLTSSLIILYRFCNYFILFFILAFSDVLFHTIKLSHKKYTPSFLVCMILVIALVFPAINEMFKPSGISNTAPIHRYYPYYSIIEPRLDPEREKIHKYYYLMHNDSTD